MRAFVVVCVLAATLSACTDKCIPTITEARKSGAVVTNDVLSSGTLSARLTTEKDQPLPQRSIAFGIGGDEVGVDTTDGRGLAVLDLKRRPLNLARAITAKRFTATFLGDFTYCGSNGEAEFRIVKR